MLLKSKCHSYLFRGMSCNVQGLSSSHRELKGKVDYIQARHEKFLTLLKSSNTAANQTFKDLRECKFERVTHKWALLYIYIPINPRRAIYILYPLLLP